MSNEKMIVKAGLWYTVSNFLSKGMLFLATPFFTRLLTQAEYGTFSNFTSWLNLLLILVTLNVDAALISARFDYAKRLDTFVYSAQVLSTLSGLVWMLVCNIFMDEVSAFLMLDPLYINSIFVYLIFFQALQLFQAQERFFYRYKLSAALSLAASGGSCLLSLVLVWVLPASARLDGRVYGHVLPAILIGAAVFVLLAVRGKRPDLRTWPYTLKVCLPYVPHLLSMTILNSTDRVMITQMRGDEETALYSVVYSVGMLVTLLLNAMNGAFSPWLGDRLHREEYEPIRKVSKPYTAVFVFFSVGLLLIAPEVLLIMGGEEYMDAIRIMVPIALGCMCQFLYTMFVNIEQFYKKTIGMAVASLSAAALNYGLNLIFIPIYGYVAAAYTTLAGYLWLLLVHMLLVRRLGKGHVYSYPFVFAVLGVMALLGVAATVLYELTLARYICLAVYCLAVLVVAWKFRDVIKRFLVK